MEKGEITPGPGTNRVIETEFGKIGVIICWDIAFPEATRKLAQQGAQIVFCPAYWYGRQHHTSEIIRILPQVRAFENQIYFVLCDAATWETAGRSRICSSLQTLAATNNTDERILIATADLEELEKRRRLFDCWRTQQRSKSDIACAFPPGSSIEEIE
ncbi:MAG: hypothetical protein A3B74_04420 [Candidatus Kerfeldbacteria bacterium RIFCSPHIGHO2_02_FULL_42_14]|uniref:CN hydrolase domain-containing protein n=1 Tax=Candidatus Kerfeldbacteria bacterium RIFCSPHIGHO2_02_FULL_42_14 TaxID=1798540 RepID=A0A1G2ANW0_9BACT|nr:MAG: hypothetical protein A3B74_04420 [Candidatus Kerfeldbacteria bacterium RIFCSPHIGHO2_02_FULL_42_14]OGY80819.1 MAG: hypothetical protein A3E60_01400 [Candidatus Kerfeldbacteria bacterium RIFCSPHIGHO2_12_FULL_42_13]OGY84991.1 MAG: hypothetical protein A3I91_00735 [Candidatus Kerfeldbacteria bacterium RIFCSPLOWO2_02_FULL_42_19]OGY86158.1 MAG: hypothetical protein A3G01_02270 [Candidatus Kerfeldbacteria bacterium RIFCSPLOWO2_12_FULL_43_9]